MDLDERIVCDSKGFFLTLFDTGRPGPSVCISGGVHGNELCGPYAINELRKFLKHTQILNGKLLTLVANPEAIRLNRRFIDFDLNRCFQNTEAYGYELQIANHISPYLAGIDYCLDLHSTSAHTKPFCAGANTPKHLLFFQLLGLEVYTHGWETHRQYSMLINEVDRLGGIGIIAECGKTGEEETNQIAYHTTLHLLQELGMIPVVKPPISRENFFVGIKQIVRANSESFYFVRSFKNLELIPANEIVAHDGNKPVYFEHEYLMIMPTQGQLKFGEEAFAIGITDIEISD